jgi:hypothetical protein
MADIPKLLISTSVFVASSLKKLAYGYQANENVGETLNTSFFFSCAHVVVHGTISNTIREPNLREKEIIENKKGMNRLKEPRAEESLDKDGPVLPRDR